MVHQEDLPGDFHMILHRDYAVRMLSLCGLGVKVFCCWLKGGQCRARNEMLQGVGEYGKGLPHCIQMEPEEHLRLQFVLLGSTSST